VEIDALDRAVADVAGQEDRRRRRAKVVSELAELLILVLPKEGLEVELQRVAQETVLAADRVSLDAFRPVGLDAPSEREAAGVIAGLEARVDHVPRREIVLSGQAISELVVLDRGIDHDWGAQHERRRL